MPFVIQFFEPFKINLSPLTIKLLSRLIITLSSIAPTDILTGNHDVNLAQLEQGDSLMSIFDVSGLLQQKENKSMYVVNQANKNTIDFSKNAAYYYTESGFYQVRKDLVYGIYSLLDGKIIKLEKNTYDKSIKTVALFHGALEGAYMDNGIKAKSDTNSAVSIKTFSNFDVVCAGDFHTFQNIDRDAEIEIDEDELDEYKAKGWEVVGKV